MIELEIKSMTSPDLEPDEPAPDARVFVLLQLEIGAKGDISSDVFSVIVATPEGLRKSDYVDKYGAVCSRNTIVVREFDWAAIRTVLGRIVSDCQDEDWGKAVLKLQRFFQWEYEDYVRVPSGNDVS